MAKQCDFCGKMYNDTWVLRISDDKSHREFSGHKECVDDMYDKHKAIKDVVKMSLEKTLKKLGLE